MMFEPVVDGGSCPGRRGSASPPGPRQAWTLVGANRHEHRFFLVPTGVLDQVDVRAVAAVATACGAARRRARPPPAPCPTSPGILLAEIMTDWFYRIPRCGSPGTRPAATWPGSPGSRRLRRSPGRLHALGCRSSSIRCTTPRAGLRRHHPPADLAATEARLDGLRHHGDQVASLRPAGGPSPGSASARPRTGGDRRSAG
jgi:hypothetical protein